MPQLSTACSTLRKQIKHPSCNRRVFHSPSAHSSVDSDSDSDNEPDHNVAGNCVMKIMRNKTHRTLKQYHNYFLAESQTHEDGEQEEAEQVDFDDVEERVQEVMTQVTSGEADVELPFSHKIPAFSLCITDTPSYKI